MSTEFRTVETDEWVATRWAHRRMGGDLMNKRVAKRKALALVADWMDSAIEAVWLREGEDCEGPDRVRLDAAWDEVADELRRRAARLT